MGQSRPLFRLFSVFSNNYVTFPCYVPRQGIAEEPQVPEAFW